jgi:tetratricopeptide (TPR) repeat protein
MAFEKAKVLKAAEKFLSQGKINAAIKEYRQIVEHDESDLTALNMLGDLCVRASKTDEAISCFHRIAEHYRDQEFTLKAIAMYKKIDRLKPRDPEIASRLATLYAAQGLVVDARAQYLIVADAYTRAGQTKKALEIFHKIADLDPQNTDIRLKLAEGYLKENLKVEAADAFVQAGRRFYDTGSYQKSLDAFNKALTLATNKNPVLRGMLAAFIALGTAEDAVELIKKYSEEMPEDRELGLMLLDACLEADDAAGAEHAAGVLISQDPADYYRLVPVAKLYLKLGEIEDTTRLLTGIVEQMLSGREEKELLEIVNEVLTSNPDQVAGLRLLVRVHWWQRDMEALRAALERLAEAAEAGGLAEDERYALTQLIRLAPDEQKFVDRLNQLGGMPEDVAQEPMFAQESFASVPEFETFALTGNDEQPVVAAETKDPYEWEVVRADEPKDPHASFAELSDNYQSNAAVESEFESHRAADTHTEVITEVHQQPAQQEGDSGARREAMMRQELESVDFYLAQGYTDIAADTLEMLSRQFGDHPEIVSRREKLKGSAAPASEPEVFEFGDAEQLHDAGAAVIEEPPTIVEAQAPPPPAPPPPAPVSQPAASASAQGSGLDAGLAEIFEEFRVAAEDEQPGTNEDFETHYNMGTAYKEMDLLDDAIHEFQTAANMVRANDGTSRFLQCCNLLGHCFVQKQMPRAAAIWFQKALEASGQNEDERMALRYELASVYESMGDTDRAIDLFTEIYGVNVNYRQVAAKLKNLAADNQKAKGKKK